MNAQKEKFGRGGQPYEMVPVDKGLVKAKPGQPGHDDALNDETRRRKHNSRFEQYAYPRLSKDQQNAFEWFAIRCEIVSSGTLSGSRWGKEMGQIDSANYGERAVVDRVTQAALDRRICQSAIQRENRRAWKAIMMAVHDDFTPAEIGALLLAKSPAPIQLRNPRNLKAELAGYALPILCEALAVVSQVMNGKIKHDDRLDP